MSTDAKFFEEAKALFFEEAREMLQQMEASLLLLEDHPDDVETLNALFRSAHTIKGSAGIFKLDAIVAFTHQVENVIGRVRKGELNIDSALSDVLLRSTDVIKDLLSQAAGDDGDAGQGLALTNGAASLTQSLARYLEDTPASAAVPATAATSEVSNGPGVWHLSLRFGADTFRNGFDPVSTVQYLSGLGELVTVVTIEDAVPDFDQFDPESCFLGFELRLRTGATKAEIEATFEFIGDDCQVRLFPPTGAEVDFVALIQALPEEPRLGDILVECGALSRPALEAALAAQKGEQARVDGASQRPVGEILVARRQVAPEVVDAALARQTKLRESRTEEASRFVRVPADRLDRLINLVSEMVTRSASAGLQAKQLRAKGLIETTQQLAMLVEDIRGEALSLRMVEIGETFGRYRRVVRDVAAELGKQVELEIEGADTELDKSVVDKIGDPLMHLVRNALDHGIETPDQRLAAGKPAQGKLVLSACHEGGGILIRIRDDGRGIHRQKVLTRAWERGIVERGVTPDDEAIIKLIFEPGFSTAETVTNLSGRGVGMDVVYRNIAALRGTVTVQSVEGQGSSIDIRLPLTLAIIDGFLVGVGSSKFIFPLEAVVEVIESRHAEVQPDARGRTCVELRGRALPTVDLRTLYALDSAPPPRVSVVVVQSGGRQFGVVVDALLGQHQTVIKPLSRMFRSLRGITGSCILGSSEVALIFDVASLSQLAASQLSPSSTQSANLAPQALS